MLPGMLVEIDQFIMNITSVCFQDESCTRNIIHPMQLKQHKTTAPVAIL